MKFILPVLAAVATTALAGLILYPLVRLVFDHFFHLYLFTTPPPDSWKDDLVILVTCIMWILIATFTGGFVCSFLSEKKEDFSIFLFIVLSFLIAMIVSGGILLKDFDLLALVPIGAYIAGAYTGSFFGIKYKNRRASFKDNPPSPPDNL